MLELNGGDKGHDGSKEWEDPFELGIQRKVEQNLLESHRESNLELTKVMAAQTALR